MFPPVGVSPEVPEPDVIAEVVEDESEAAGPRGHPAGGGAEEAVLDVDWVTLTRETMELQDVAVISDSLVNLNLVTNNVYLERNVGNFNRVEPYNRRHG